LFGCFCLPWRAPTTPQALCKFLSKVEGPIWPKAGTWPWHIAGSRSDELLACPTVANWRQGGQGAGGPGQSAGGQGQGSRNYFTWFETRPAARGPKKDPCTRSPKERRRAVPQALAVERAGAERWSPAQALAAALERRPAVSTIGAVHGRRSGHRCHQLGQAAFASLESTRCHATRQPCFRNMSHFAQAVSDMSDLHRCLQENIVAIPPPHIRRGGLQPAGGAGAVG
jgi:hypothetical protein